jgi:mono/diheme cytochrome c family protein
MSRPLSSVLVAVVAVGALAGCRGGSAEDPPIVLIRNMYNQAKYTAQHESDYFADKRTMRLPVEGTVPASVGTKAWELDDEISSGRTIEGDKYVAVVPEAVIKRNGGAEALVARGQERFNIYCTPCHAQTGLGNGTVVQKGLQRPPSLHDARIREMPDGQLYATIKNGVRNMPAYGPQVPVDDRWAIVSYVRALELTQVSQLESPK